MDIIYENLPEIGDEVDLVIESSILNKNSKIIYKNDDKKEEKQKNKNEIFINENKYKFNIIDKDLEKEKLSNLITSQINIKNNITLLLLLNNNTNNINEQLQQKEENKQNEQESQKEESKQEENNQNNQNAQEQQKDEEKKEENINSTKKNYNIEIRNIIKNLFNKENIEQLKIKNIIYHYYQINTETNKSQNIIKDKLVNFNENEESSYAIEIPNDDGNVSISFLKLEINYSDLDISSYLQILFIYNSYEKIVPFFALNKKDYEITLLKEKINNLLSLEKDIREQINKITIVNGDYLQNAHVYEQEVINYFNSFVNNLKKIENIEKKEKNDKNNKDNINSLIKEAKEILNSISNEQFKQREKDLYEKYLQVYSNINTSTQSSDNNIDNINELRMTINNFNNLNEELIDILENNNKDKDKDNNKNINIEKDKEQLQEKDNEINELKNKINQLEEDLKEEKSKNLKPNKSKDREKEKEKGSKNRSASAMKVGSAKDIKSNQNINNNLRLEEENKNLKKNIEEMKETISKLKANNDNLFKTNEKLLKEKNNLKNELIKEKTSNANSNDNTASNELYYSPSKPSNITRFNSTNKNPKKVNKNITNQNPIFSGQSLILLQKISDENKQLAKQLKDFNSKNFQLELSLKGINNGEVNIKNQSNNNSMLNNFTKNTRSELKNIEKKYGIKK
jgi:hypothetical protein